jgi:hypothetical protein
VTFCFDPRAGAARLWVCGHCAVQLGRESEIRSHLANVHKTARSARLDQGQTP